MDFKTCRGCGETKPATAEFFPLRKDSPDGLRARCKVCHRATKRDWDQRNIERVRERGRINMAKYRAADPEKYRAAWREHYHSDEVFRRYDIARRMANANKDPDAKRAANRDWWARHRDDMAQLRRKRWAEDPERHREYGRRRRARKMAAPGSHTADDIKTQYKRQHGRCYWCGESVGGGYHADHVVPLSRGGSDDIGNIVIACPSCNLKKNTKMPHEFADRIC
jgi:5-methylcytosine-specific restriction endonuclease McrA